VGYRCDTHLWLPAMPGNFALGLRKRAQLFSAPLIGPQGGAAYQIVTDPHDPSIVYAGTTVGVFKSTDGGHEWFASNAGLPLPAGFKDYSAANGPYVYALAIDPQNSNTLYAGITYVNYYGIGEPYGRGVYKSDDAGSSWSAAIGGSDSVTALAIDAQTPTTFYAIAWVNPYAHRRVYKFTKELGWRVTFELRTPPVPTTHPPVATDPHSSGTVYVGDGTRVFKSTNGGATWTDMSDGLSGGVVRELIVDDVDSNIVYARAGSVYKSLNGGQSWQVASTGIIGSVSALVKVSGARTLYAAAAAAPSSKASTEPPRGQPPMAARPRHLSAWLSIRRIPRRFTQERTVPDSTEATMVAASGALPLSATFVCSRWRSASTVRCSRVTRRENSQTSHLPATRHGHAFTRDKRPGGGIRPFCMARLFQYLPSPLTQRPRTASTLALEVSLVRNVLPPLEVCTGASTAAGASVRQS
jgi:hypothetical protein